MITPKEMIEFCENGAIHCSYTSIDPEGAAMFQAIRDFITANSWQPIETAPKDRERVLLYVPPYGAMSGHYYLGWNCHSCLNKEAAPTHWMPLPQPPEDQR